MKVCEFCGLQSAREKLSAYQSETALPKTCLLYTSDAADESPGVDLGGLGDVYKRQCNYCSVLGSAVSD